MTILDPFNSNGSLICTPSHRAINLKRTSSLQKVESEFGIRSFGGVGGCMLYNPAGMELIRVVCWEEICGEGDSSACVDYITSV